MILLTILMMISWTQAAKRDRSTGEIAIAPTSVTQFETYKGNNATNAVDLDLDTASIASSDPMIDDGQAWFKATLEEALCLERIKVWHSKKSGDSVDEHDWTCTETGCTCDGLPSKTCADYTVTISTEAEYDQTLSDCKYGDTVEVQNTIINSIVKINEIAIFEKQAPCTNKPSITNGKVEPDSSPIESGAMYTVTCNDGFVIDGSSEMTCTHGSLSAAPTCDPAPCTTKPDVGNGTITPDPSTTNSIDSGSKYTATCDTGYVLSGNNPEITCTNGVLSSPYPTCDPAPCTTKPDVANAAITPDPSTINKIPSGSKYTATCNPGYILKGNPEITCTNGELSSPYPTCVSDWTDIVAESRDYLNFNLDATPLEIVTNVALNQSSTKMVLEFFNKAEAAAGGIEITFGTPQQFRLLGCHKTEQSFSPAKLSMFNTGQNVNVWKIVKPASASFEIYYNDKKVFEETPTTTTCDDNDWESVSKIASEKIKFGNSDDASLKFRAATTKPSVVCTSKEAVFIRGQITGCTENFYLKASNDPGCQFGSDQKIISTELHKCGSEVTYDDTNVYYNNTATCGDPSADISDPNDVYRDTDKLEDFQFRCSYPRTGTLKNPSWSVPGIRQVELSGESYLEFALEVYNAEYDQQQINFPLEVELNSDLHMQLSVKSDDPGMVMAIEEVYATTSVDSGDEEGSKLSLWKDGCPKDPTAEAINPDAPKEKRFKFKVFKFAEDKEPRIYVHAKVKVCGEDIKDECSKDCGEKRRRRRDALTETTPENIYEVSLGPFIIKDPQEGDVSSISGAREKMMYHLLFLTLGPLFWFA